jgi:hypothetical protein
VYSLISNRVSMQGDLAVAIKAHANILFLGLY